MLRIRPSDIILSAAKGCMSKGHETGDFWMAYEWFCRRFIEWKKVENIKASCCEVLEAGSSINHTNFYPCYSYTEPAERLAYMLARCYDSGGLVTKFLQWLRLTGWASLDKPIAIKGRRPKRWPQRSWFESEGRILKTPGPNSCHPKALFVQKFGLKFCVHNKRWKASITYGYPHDSSSWHLEKYQGKKQSLDSFADEINTWIENICEPDPNPLHRIYIERDWQTIRDAVDELFWSDYREPEMERVLADRLAPVRRQAGNAAGKIELTIIRKRTLLRWAKSKAEMSDK